MFFILIFALLVFGGLTSSQEYLGCFSSNSSDPDMPILVLNGVNSPSECIDACKMQYYKYAGLMATKCYCGSSYGGHGPSNSCTIYCINARNMLCGSYDAISIYATGQKGPSPPRLIRLHRKKPNGLIVSWSYPDNPNGNITSYTIRADAIETYSSKKLFPFETQVQGGTSNMTILDDLEPGTRYNVSVIATNTEGESQAAYSDNWTYIGPAEEPLPPKIVNYKYNTIDITIEPGHSEKGPISSYQIVVVNPGLIPPKKNDQSYPDFYRSREEGLGYYVTAAFDASDFESYRKFTVGNGRNIGGYFNAPLNVSFIPPQIGLVVVSRIAEEVQYSYSNLTSSMYALTGRSGSGDGTKSTVAVLLWIGIMFLGALLVSSILVYVFIRRKFEGSQKRLSDHQELTLQGPLVEVDNVAYIPEDVPETSNRYQRRFHRGNQDISSNGPLVEVDNVAYIPEDVPECTNHYRELKNKVWTIPQNLLTIDSTIIRRGRFGTVHRGNVQKDGKTIPASVHSISDVSMSNSKKKQMLRELDICIRAGATSNLAGLIGTCETADTLYVVLELPSETLKNRLVSSRLGNPFPAGKITQIGSAIASALQHLARIKIVHGYVCARSIGLDNNFNPKLMGHGIAKYSLEDMKFARWTATECFALRTGHHPGTVWAFGVLLWEMFSLGGTPYSHLKLESEVEEAVERGERLPQLPVIPDPIYEVMMSCWASDPQERPFFDELMRLNTLSCLPVITSDEPYLPELELNQY